MYSNILVTLDGSELAETALPHVKTVYRGCTDKPKVTVLMVAKPSEKPYGSTPAAVSRDTIMQFEQMDQERIEKGKRYLDKIASAFNKLDIPVTTKILIGKPAEAILEYINTNNCDLLIMSTHGRSGVSQWVFGSVAERVLRHVRIPIVMIRAPKCGTLFSE